MTSPDNVTSRKYNEDNMEDGIIEVDRAALRNLKQQYEQIAHTDSFLDSDIAVAIYRVLSNKANGTSPGEAL